MTAKLYGFDRSFLHDTTERDPFVIDMVRADDYLKLEAKIAALQEQVRALAAENSALARYFSASSVAVNHWNSWADTEDKLACAPETPAADAVVREIRKQAVEGFSEFCGDNSVFIQATCNYDSLADAASIYLARIRAGEKS